MQPIPILEKHLIFKPSRPPSSGSKAGPQQGQAGQLKALQGQMHGDLFYLKLVQEVKNERGASEGEDANGVNGEREKGDVVMGEGGTSGVCHRFVLTELCTPYTFPGFDGVRRRFSPGWLIYHILDASIP